MYLIAFQPKTPEKKRRELFDDVGFEQSNSFEELEASGSSQSPLYPHSTFEELEASGSSQSPLHPHSSFEELEASSTTLHGSPETLAHSSPLQPLSHSKLIPITP